MAATAFNDSIMIVNRDHLGYHLKGPYEQNDPTGGVVVYVAKGTGSEGVERGERGKTLIALNNHPPPGGLEGTRMQSEIPLNDGDRVTVFPNGDIIIDRTIEIALRVP